VELWLFEEVLDRIVLQTGETLKINGVTRKKMRLPKKSVFGLRLKGQNRVETFVSRNFAGEVYYRSIGSKEPLIDILYRENEGERKRDSTK